MKLLTIAAMLAGAMLLVVSSTVAAAQYQPPPTLEVSPPNPRPGDPITVTISGCEPFGGEVPVFVDGVLVGKAELDDTGSFTGDFLVPDEAAGEVMVEVRCDNEVLGSIITVQTAELPFIDDDAGDAPGPNLPRTGANSAPLAQAGLALIGVGAIFWAISTRRHEPAYVPLHAETPGSTMAGTR